ncbi:protein of unknown function [Zhouia amylolytica]|uniref:3-keto-alpha-glucoside-1,2-lyase/3-keto-2-hydroxy-glucal hydratase domain-containing protein n=2 Tax=Zhouia amylolytica TaxID=376730 RepID=W2UKM8_9FLAO|nr:DUF1080 domain-containing protein [Zhouia amylolytica]ETN94553.1 protein of unknown function (DUF1080) [Zhouia amylolytica AD3]MCQ0111556.1 DUF1080 domain-containing protein [Zhouia amylolytica]SFS78275.1 protein of unknown function [Zhouia amylolytica]
MNKSLLLSTLILFSVITSCKNEKKEVKQESKTTVTLNWEQLFNGKDLSGWTPKISKHELGENFGETFRIEDGKMVVRYDQYGAFDQQYGHIFYNQPFSAYFLAVEYRFVGEQAQEGEGWAWRNSGVMLHGQDPKTMTVNQNFPISIEAQFLGGDGENERTTLNLCTPGTNVFIKDTLFTPHCISSTSKTYHGDQWVRAGFLVLKDSLVQHYTGDKVVMEYTKPQIGGGMVNETSEGVQIEGKALTQGYISLQSESHPIEFRKVEIIDLEPIYNDKPLLETTIETILKEEAK